MINPINYPTNQFHVKRIRRDNFFVSHDLDFVSRLAARVVELTSTSLHSYPGSYEEYCQLKKPQELSAKISNFKTRNSTKPNLSQLEQLKKQETRNRIDPFN